MEIFPPSVWLVHVGFVRESNFLHKTVSVAVTLLLCCSTRIIVKSVAWHVYSPESDFSTSVMKSVLVSRFREMEIRLLRLFPRFSPFLNHSIWTSWLPSTTHVKNTLLCRSSWRTEAVRKVAVGGTINNREIEFTCVCVCVFVCLYADSFCSMKTLNKLALVN